MFLSRRKQESNKTVAEAAIDLSTSEGFEKAYEELAPFVFSICRQYIDDRTECEDIISKIFVSLWERRDSIKIKESLKAYLFKAVKLQVSDYYKLKHRRTERLQHAAENLGFLDAKVENEIWHLDFTQRFESAVNSLPPRRKEVFTLIKLEGLTIRRTAQKLSLSESTVITHLYKAIDQVKELLADDLPTVQSMGS